MNSVAVFGVLHHNNSKFFKEFINSLNDQTYKSFDLFLVVEYGIGIEFKNLFFKGNFVIKKNKKFTSPKENRDLMFKYLRESNYKICVLSDLDDILSSDRVEKSVFAIKNEKYDIVYNDIIPFTNNIFEFKKSFWLNRKNFKDLKINYKYNFMGLGNSSISNRMFKNYISVENNDIYDWEYFLKLNLKFKLKISYVNTFTYYRQNNSIISLNDTSVSHLKSLAKKKITVLKALNSNKNEINLEIQRMKKIIRSSNLKFNKNRINNYYWFEQTNDLKYE